MLLIVGIVIVLGSVAGGYLMHGGSLLALNQPSEFIIIGGAALGGLVISTPLPLLKSLIGQVGRFFGRLPTRDDYLDLLALQYQLFKLTQQSGVMALESHVEDPEKSPIFAKFPAFLANHHAVAFMSDSIRVIILGGIAPHDLEALMDQDLEVHHETSLKPAQTLGKVADALPGLGIVAAVLGIVNTMGALGGPPEEIGIKVAAALVGTFLGILFAYGLIGPMSKAMERRAREQTEFFTAIKTCIMGFLQGHPPQIAIEFGRKSTPADLRPSFRDLEAQLRGKKA